ncbi:ABC transporter permease [Salinicoccus sp. YB14-2]|uniref:ABC transporter permease n=1 Tax=Salinicoccus sp. YB14-2 TaxID=1572701 RepID=UPI0006901884|nr:ABC transporter permease [Salinicoccus sp. YB14-2]
MKKLLITRWMLLKPVLWRVLLWLFLPLILTVFITGIVNQTSDDFRVPVAVVVEGEQGEVTGNILNSLESSEFIRLDKFEVNEKEYVLHQLEQYNYDSAFILMENFENKISDNDRDNLIKAYYTDRSLFYVPVKEQLASLIQEYLGALSVYEEVYSLRDEFAPEQNISEQEIDSRLEIIREESNLLTQELSFQDTETTYDYEGVLNPWMVWGYMTIMLSVFMFDMINKEYRGNISDRFRFTTISHKSYLLYSLIMYTFVVLCIDLLTYFLINVMFDADISIFGLLMFRIFCNVMGFMLAVIARSPFGLYRLSLAVTVVLLSLHAMRPLAANNVQPVYEYLHPVESLMEGSVSVLLPVLLLVIIFWKGRGSGVES